MTYPEIQNTFPGDAEPTTNAPRHAVGDAVSDAFGIPEPLRVEPYGAYPPVDGEPLAPTFQPSSFVPEAAGAPWTAPQDAEAPTPTPEAVRPLTTADVVEAPPVEALTPSTDPELVGPTAAALLLADSTGRVRLGDGTSLPVRFDMLSLSRLEKRYGSVIAPMRKLEAGAKDLESSSEDSNGGLIETTLETLRFACARQRINVAGLGSVKVADAPEQFLELVADGPDGFVDILKLVLKAFSEAFGASPVPTATPSSAEGNAPTAASVSPGGSGGTTPSATYTSGPATSGA